MKELRLRNCSRPIYQILEFKHFRKLNLKIGMEIGRQRNPELRDLRKFNVKYRVMIEFASHEYVHFFSSWCDSIVIDISAALVEIKTKRWKPFYRDFLQNVLALAFVCQKFG